MKIIGVLAFCLWVFACIMTITTGESRVFLQALSQGTCAYLTFMILIHDND